MSTIERGYQRTGAEDREVTELLRDFDRAIARLNELGVDVLRLRGLSDNTPGAVAALCKIAAHDPPMGFVRQRQIAAAALEAMGVDPATCGGSREGGEPMMANIKC